MRIKKYWFQKVIDTELVTFYEVKVVGHVPGVGIVYTETPAGITENLDDAGSVVGDWIRQTLTERKILQVIKMMKLSEEDAISYVEKNPPVIPNIPGVTVELDVIWKNAKFGGKYDRKR